MERKQVNYIGWNLEAPWFYYCQIFAMHTHVSTLSLHAAMHIAISIILFRNVKVKLCVVGLWSNIYMMHSHTITNIMVTRKQ